MKKILLFIFVLSTVLMVKPNPSYAQLQGSWSIGWSIGFVTKGGAFVKYYVDDGIALELFGGGFPHIWHAGTEVSVHPLMLTSSNYPNLAFTGGYSWFGGFGSYSSSNGQGLNLGVEFSFTTKKSQLFVQDGIGINENFYLSVGSTYITKEEVTIHNLEEYQKINSHSDTTHSVRKWIPFFEGGAVIYNER